MTSLSETEYNEYINLKNNKIKKEDIHNINNMTNMNSSDSTALLKSMLFFYIIIASNYTENLYSKQLRTFFNENRFAQHLIGLIMMFTFIMIIGGITEIDKGILYSLIGYIWFLFTTKLDIHWNIIIILLLLFGFIYESKLSQKKEAIISDLVLSDDEKIKLVNEQQQYEFYILIAIISITVIGSFLYINKKGVQYGGGFDVMQFMFY
ncbi:MAG: hypothetical protein Terrestrivirus4_16 [Terrestrivirus sp.]|uniref:Uncharacterized protein n=1 Tax=Terrestrivirus sp. TaxID=2487775 RepID=A0A3G4ZMA1_9VIRU|nr:MAG: hypothetical protein Terrestrivirus4_16 [Terrestrivirus sp.]